MAGQPRGFVAVSSPDGKGKKGLRPALHVTIGTGQRCPYCHEHLSGDDPLVACAECLTVFHAGCVTEGGGCTTMGCAHARPDVAPAPARSEQVARARRPAPLTVAALVVGLVGAGLGAWAALRPSPLIVDRWPPPPPVSAPQIVTFDASLAGDVLQVRAIVEATAGARAGDQVLAARINGIPVPLLPAGWRGGHHQVAADLPRRQVLGDATGSLPVELTILSAGPAVSATRWVRVEPPPPQVIVVERGPTLRLNAESVQTRDSMVDVRGFVDADGPVSITVRSPAGDVSWEAQPGAFYGTVTVGPRSGTYDLVVRVRDRHGREATAVQRVEYFASR